MNSCLMIVGLFGFLFWAYFWLRPVTFFWFVGDVDRVVRNESPIYSNFLSLETNFLLRIFGVLVTRKDFAVTNLLLYSTDISVLSGWLTCTYDVVYLAYGLATGLFWVRAYLIRLWEVSNELPFLLKLIELVVLLGFEC